LWSTAGGRPDSRTCFPASMTPSLENSDLSTV
jgi:hypothetical protein